MASEKALYWMAVGLVALVAGNHFVARFDGQRLADRSMVVWERLSGQSGHLFSTMLDTADSRCARSEAAMARAQARIASAQMSMARQDAACARLQAEKARLMAMEHMQEMSFRVVVPQNFRVEIPEITAPQVRVVSSNDPI